MSNRHDSSKQLDLLASTSVRNCMNITFSAPATPHPPATPPHAHSPKPPTPKTPPPRLDPPACPTAPPESAQEYRDFDSHPRAVLAYWPFRNNPVQSR